MRILRFSIIYLVLLIVMHSIASGQPYWEFVQSPSAKVRITRIDRNGIDHSIEILNDSGEIVDISNWTLEVQNAKQDNPRSLEEFTFPTSCVIPNNWSVAILSGPAHLGHPSPNCVRGHGANEFEVLWTAAFILPPIRDGGIVFLRDANKNLISEISYPPTLSPELVWISSRIFEFRGEHWYPLEGFLSGTLLTIELLGRGPPPPESPNYWMCVWVVNDEIDCVEDGSEITVEFKPGMRIQVFLNGGSGSYEIGWHFA